MNKNSIISTTRKPSLWGGLVGLLLLGAMYSCTQKTTNLIPDGFVYIPETYIQSGSDSVKIGAFEIMDHPVTNKEYATFIKAIDHPAPNHWENGKIPAGFDDYPVIYVNREDAYAYTQWLTEQDKRVYKLPTSQQFEVAARSGTKGKYYWGNDKSLLTQENINYDIDINRPFDQWHKYLKPARWGMQNEAGLYGMAGNIWQMTLFYPDPEKRKYYFRLEKESDYDRVNLAGGSWARSKEYLVCGQNSYRPSGIKSPDVGIRLIREPEGEAWKIIPRKVAAVSTKEGNVALSWAVLSNDKINTGYNIYRLKSKNRDTDGTKINDEPVTNSSYYLDTKNISVGERYQYRIVPVDEQGKEGNPSEWTGITVNPQKQAEVITFAPISRKPGGMVPVFGDLEGVGRPGCVIRLGNGNTEMSQDPGHPVQLEAFTSYGRSLWRKDIASHGNVYGNANNCPFNVWDMDGDGKAEVITLLQVGEDNYVAILDGITGKVKYKTPWPAMATDNVRSSTRIQLSIGYLDGKNPSVITQNGIYENEVITAFDAQLNHMWTYNSFGTTSGTGGHKVEIADVDGDGKQEVIYGTTCLNSDGTLRWSIYRGHPDIVSIQDYIPERPGPEVFFLVETNMHAGAYLVDADTGEVIWKSNKDDDKRWSHGHFGWAADILDSSSGKEFVVTRSGHNDANYVVFDAHGNILQEPFPPGILPIEWNGDNTRELITDNAHRIGKWNGKKIVWEKGINPNPIADSKFLFSADLYGDFRDELVVIHMNDEGREVISIITSTELMDKKYIAPSEDINYRLWLARNYGGGYPSIFDNPYVMPATPPNLP